jgi:serine/threonine protein kinase/tetratricopeptide (TPR) repeat protein
LRADKHELADLAASVADGTPVDWNAVELRERPSEQRLVRHLRLVESIASLHRSIPTAVDDDPLNAVPVRPGRDGAALKTPSSGPHWGRLTLLERIGQGTSCEVYRAWDTTLHREVALKLLHQAPGIPGAAGDNQRDAHTRLLEEARRLARLRHEHVVQVYGAEQHDGRVGLWMELVRGESLEQAVKARGVFGAREAAVTGLDICSALAAVHAAGLLHRDVKAQNVMREERGRTVLMDFGTGEELAGTNRLVGTPLYLAPEIFRGQRASVQSDVYSMGVLLFYLVTGRFPVIASSMEGLQRAHERRERQSLRDLRPDVPEAFVRTVERAIDSDPTRRFQTVGDLEASLRESLDAPAPQLWARTPLPRRWLDPRFGVAAGLLAAVISGLIVWTGWPPSMHAGAVDSLAVLPLVDKSSSAPSELSEALTEQLIATIGMVDSLRTTSLMSTMPFKASAKPAQEIAKVLGVDAVLEGVLTATDEGGTDRGKLRLDAKLVSAAGTPLWQGSATRRRGESEALLSDIARMVTRAIRARVEPDEESRLRQVRRTNRVAEEAYLQGRLHLVGMSRAESGRALDSFLRAIDADPDYAAAHASAALAYVKFAAFGGMTHGEARSKASYEVRRASETGEEIAETHAAAADIKLLYDWDWEGAERELRRSLDLNPGFLYARNVYAQFLARQQRFDESLKLSEESLAMDPQSVDALVNHGMLLYYKRDYAAADEVSQRALTMQPASGGALILRSRVAEAQQRYDDALAAALEAGRIAGDENVNVRVVIIRLQALAGHLAEARAATAALERAAREGKLLVRARDFAYVYLGLGRRDEALSHFERAVDERDPLLVWLSVEPRVDPLRTEPRFQAILKKIGLN